MRLIIYNFVFSLYMIFVGSSMENGELSRMNWSPESLNAFTTSSIVTVDNAVDSVKLMSFCDGTEIEI